MTSPDREVRDGFQRLQRLVQAPPLSRPPLEPVEDVTTGRFEVYERPPGAHEAIPIDQAGFGPVQLYTILTSILVSGAPCVALEEPEAHLHAPTTGRDLRDVLTKLVTSGTLTQVFIATHSNLFDLDPDGYFDVRLEDGASVVERRDLSAVDAHLYEPGPAKHALQRMLRYAPPDETVFRRPDGSPVSAEEMLHLLQVDDAAAVSFLQDVHGAAIRAVGARARRRSA